MSRFDTAHRLSSQKLNWPSIISLVILIISVTSIGSVRLTPSNVAEATNRHASTYVPFQVATCEQEIPLEIAPNLSSIDRLRALSDLSGKRGNGNDLCSAEVWGPEYAETSVKFLIASFDRPQELRRVLVALDAFVLGHYSVNVFFLASEDIFSQAYELLRRQFPSHKFQKRTEDNYFSLLRESVTSSNDTNFVIMSDDTVFIRPIDIRKLATLQNILSVDPNVKYSVQLRSSSRDKRPDILASFLPAWGLPYVQVVNCSRILRRHDTSSPDFASCCYDRHIDGAMFTRQNIEAEFDTLEQSARPTHPGSLEGNWMAITDTSSWEELAIFPPDRVVMNIGLDFGTVRDDRKFIESEGDIHHSAAARLLGAKNLLRGCYLDPPPLGYYLQIDQTHGSVENQFGC